ncbi:MAG: hypothetical protein WDO13_04640 [Verrucomicrobiota bacterium]
MNAYFFKPIFQERIWGAQQLKTLFGCDLPEGKKIGESWELVDRPEACSEIASGARHRGPTPITACIACGRKSAWRSSAPRRRTSRAFPFSSSCSTARKT